jgi:hypothetical protein
MREGLSLSLSASTHSLSYSYKTLLFPALALSARPPSSGSWRRNSTFDDSDSERERELGKRKSEPVRRKRADSAPERGVLGVRSREEVSSGVRVELEEEMGRGTLLPEAKRKKVDDELGLEELNADFPPGPLDSYRKQASFDWKVLRSVIEDEKLLRFKVRPSTSAQPIFQIGLCCGADVH